MADLFDIQKLGSSVPEIRTWEFHETLDSTNDRVKELFRQSDPAGLPCLVIARAQTAGRGRDRKKWWSAEGALLMSLGFEIEPLGLSRRNLPLLSLGAALSVAETLDLRVSDASRVNIHWPNDVFLDGRKISGILLESPDPRHVLLGIGVNVNNRCREGLPEEFSEKRSIVSLIDVTGKKSDFSPLIVDFLRRFHYNCALIVDTPGELVSRIRGRCLQLGRDVTLWQGTETVTGRAVDLAQDGSLIVETSSGPRSVVSGTVLAPEGR